MMQSASHVAESLRDSEEPQLRCGVSLGEADLRGGVQREGSHFQGLAVGGAATEGMETQLSIVRKITVTAS